MPPLTGFTAYPSSPFSIGSTIRAALDIPRTDAEAPRLTTWEENDIAGRFIVDLTRLNFNVVFEVGYSIGKRKRDYLVRNVAITGADDLVREVGFLIRWATSGTQTPQSWQTYSGKSPTLVRCRWTMLGSIRHHQCIWFCHIKTDVEIRLLSRIKKARLQFRSFDPEEHGRLAAGEAIENVAQSHGVVVPPAAERQSRTGG